MIRAFAYEKPKEKTPMNMPLEAALAQLDSKNDTHWTADGQPVIAVLNEMTGSNVTRSDVKTVAPDLLRSTAVEPKNWIAPPLEETTVVEDLPLTEITDTEIAKEFEDEDIQNEVAIATDEDILAAEPTDLGNDVEALDRWMNASERKLNDLDAEGRRIAKEISMWARRADIISRVRDRAKRASGEKQHTIQDFLKRQREARTDRAERARAFITAGTTAQDVVKELSGKSPIDTALGQRKAKLGSTRPAMGLPVRK